MNGNATTRPDSGVSIRFWQALIAIVVLALASTAIAQPPEGRQHRRGGPRDGRMFDDGDRPGPWRERFDRDDAPLPPDVVEKMLSIVRERFPDRFERLMRLRERNPERFQRFLQRKLGPIIGEYMELREENPDLAEGMIEEFRGQEQLHALVDEYQDAKGPEARAAIESKMEEIVRRQFSLIERRMAHRLQQFEERLDDQRRRLERHRKQFGEERANIDEHVARRMEELKSGQVRPPRPRFGPGGPPDDEFAAPLPGPRRLGDGDGPRFRDGKGGQFRDGDEDGENDRRRFRDGHGGRRGGKNGFDRPEDEDRRPLKDEDRDDDDD